MPPTPTTRWPRSSPWPPPATSPRSGSPATGCLVGGGRTRPVDPRRRQASPVPGLFAVEREPPAGWASRSAGSGRLVLAEHPASAGVSAPRSVGRRSGAGARDSLGAPPAPRRPAMVCADRRSPCGQTTGCAARAEARRGTSAHRKIGGCRLAPAHRPICSPPGPARRAHRPLLRISTVSDDGQCLRRRSALAAPGSPSTGDGHARALRPVGLSHRHRRREAGGRGGHGTSGALRAARMSATGEGQSSEPHTRPLAYNFPTSRVPTVPTPLVSTTPPPPRYPPAPPPPTFPPPYFASLPTRRLPSLSPSIPRARPPTPSSLVNLPMGSMISARSVEI